MEKSFGQTAKELGVLVGILLISFIILDNTTTIFKTDKTPQDKIPLKVQVPDPSGDYDGTGGPEEPKKLDLLGNNISYKPSWDVYLSSTVYNKEAEAVALYGTFASAEFIVKGEITNDKDNFLSINIGKAGGVYGVDRLRGNYLEVVYENALFNKRNPIDIAIDLLSPSTLLSVTGKDLSLGKDGHNSYYLWQYIQPPPESGTIVKVLFVPFSKDGVIGETSLTKIEFQYRCQEKGSCRVALCDKEQRWSDCLEKKIGKGTSASVVKFFNSR